MSAVPFLMFGIACLASAVSYYAFQRELIDKGHVDGSPWDRRLWVYLRWYHDPSLDAKRLIAIGTNIAAIACLVWITTVWR